MVQSIFAAVIYILSYYGVVLEMKTLKSIKAEYSSSLSKYIDPVLKSMIKRDGDDEDMVCFFLSESCLDTFSVDQGDDLEPDTVAKLKDGKAFICNLGEKDNAFFVMEGGELEVIVRLMSEMEASQPKAAGIFQEKLLDMLATSDVKEDMMPILGSAFYERYLATLEVLASKDKALEPVDESPDIEVF